jgi:hypothetical protein
MTFAAVRIHPRTRPPWLLARLAKEDDKPPGGYPFAISAIAPEMLQSCHIFLGGSESPDARGQSGTSTGIFYLQKRRFSDLAVRR